MGMAMNQDMGTFLTETKASTKVMFTPANRRSSQNELEKNQTSQPSLGESPSPSSANNMMSFNFFVTQVPIE